MYFRNLVFFWSGPRSRLRKLKICPSSANIPMETPCRSCCFPESQQGLAMTFQLSCSQSEYSRSRRWTHYRSSWCSVSFLSRTRYHRSKSSRNDACVLFHFLYCLDHKPVRPGARSVRRYYISSVLQVTTQHRTKSLSGHWCLDGLHSIIHDLFCSGLQ